MADGLLHCVEKGDWYPTVILKDAFRKKIWYAENKVINLHNIFLREKLKEMIKQRDDV